jgi:hypothetical protein
MQKLPSRYRELSGLWWRAGIYIVRHEKQTVTLYLIINSLSVRVCFQQGKIVLVSFNKQRSSGINRKGVCWMKELKVGFGRIVKRRYHVKAGGREK